MMAARDYDEGLEASMSVWQGAAAKIAEESTGLDIEETHLAPMLTLIERAIADGRAEKEFGALFELLVGGRS